ncbi:MAG TPA: hypothetical protein DCG75_17000 [Bacteroidales bacterium]|jgi:hypothetical protein|nr:hypothetical protein [Bacteroidales bacterium]
MIYFNNQKACVIYLKQKNTAYIAVDGFVDSISVRKLMIKILELSLKTNVKYLLVDTLKLEIIRDDDIKWILQEIYPGFKLAPLKRIAYVKPENVFGVNSVKKLIPQNTLKEFKEFLSIEEAEKWIFKSANSKALV